MYLDEQQIETEFIGIIGIIKRPAVAVGRGASRIDRTG